MTIQNSLSNVSSYPVPISVIENITEGRGLDMLDEVNVELRASAKFQLAVADVKQWVSEASDFSQGGISYEVSTETKELLRAQANAVYKLHNDPLYEVELQIKPTYGYKGTRL